MRRRFLVDVALLLAFVARGAFAQLPPNARTAERPVVVASKPFAESYLLAELFAQTLERAGRRVERRAGLGATEIAFGALRTGAIDVYPEYTGTGLVAILGETPSADARAVFRRVRTEFAARHDSWWLPPLGFENSYAIAVRRTTADSLSLRTLSDLARVAPTLVGGFSPDFIGREDGLVGLRGTYGAMRFRAERALLQAVKYRALASGDVDVVDGYSTDGAIARYDLVVLEDDRGFFPAYEAAPLVSGRLYRDDPVAIAALTSLAGMLDEATMRALNERVEVGGEPVEQVAADALRSLSASATDTLVPNADARRSAGSLATYLWERRALIGALAARHLALVAGALLAAVLLAVPAGVLLARLRPGSAEAALRGAGVVQTIPGIALLAFMIPILGIGVTPALVALFLYAIYPILRNSYVGVRDAAPDAVDAARALGMTDAQLLRHVRLPIGFPVIMAGIRTAAVITVGTATLAAFIGAGGLGDPIVAGLALSDTRMVLSGAIPAALLAIVVDLALAQVERLLRV